MKVLITGACGVTSRAVVRSLKLSKHYHDTIFIGTDVAENPYGFFEGLYSKIYKCPHVNDPKYYEWMNGLCKKENPDAAIIMPELESIFWSARGFPATTILPPPKFSHIVISKARLYSSLTGTDLIPKFSILEKDDLLKGRALKKWPIWLRDFSEAGSSGKGSFLASNHADVVAWVTINPKIDKYLVADYLPKGNYACHLLFDQGNIVKIACYERLEYFMARTTISGISGNICKGRLLWDDRLPAISEKAVRKILDFTGEEMNGLIAVDLKEDENGLPRITEINLRHVAATYAFALAGFNLAEAHLSLILGRRNEIGDINCTFPKNNIILRDIDGELIWRSDYRPLAIGEYLECIDVNEGSIKNG